MAKYKSLKGQPIQVLTADPPAPVEGQVWVVANPGTASVMKGYRLGAATWASGGNVNTARNSSRGIGAVNTAMIAAGGYDGTNLQAITEQYNGSSWTEVGDMNTAKSQGAASGQAPYTNGIMFGGSPALAVAETWNGSSWTEVGDLNTGRRELAGAGISSTNALAMGGQNNTDNLAVTESWNGSSWTEVGDLNTGRAEDAGAGGSNTAALIFGGGPPNKANTEIWNGNSWTEVNDLNAAKSGVGGAGDVSSALVFGANPASVNTEIWDGTSWTETNNLSVARRMPGAGGTSLSSLAISGLNASNGEIATTEEWSQVLATVSFDID